MSVIDHVRLRRLDMTVLLVFLGLARLGKATLVGRELGLTQSAVSHALKRLRETFDDDLFLRRPHGLEPTSTALAILPSVRAAVDAAARALAGHDPFDPATASGLVRVGAYDSALTTLVPALIHDFAGRAPSLCVSALTLGGRAALDALAGDRVDVVVGLARPAGPDFVSTPLYEETYRVVGRADDPLMAGPLDLDAYVAARHVIASPSGEPRGIVDETLERLGRRRTVTAALPLFLPVLAAVAATGALATVPSQVAAAHAARFGLVSRRPPLAIRSFPVGAIVHRRNAASPRHVWTIETLVRLAAGMNDPDQVGGAAARPHI